MPGYGVPADDEGLLPWPWAQERLVTSRNYWVVTASAAGRPHAMPTWGVWDAERDVFAFWCSAESRKARNLRVNPQITVAADSTVECVSVEGHARRCSGDLLDTLVTAWAAKYEPDEAARPALEDFARQSDAYVVTPERAFGIIERPEEFSARATRWRWAPA